MDRKGLLIGEIAARAGVSRKALRLYEAAGILPPPQRTDAGYRLYGSDALAALEFVGHARRLGFTLAEIKEIVTIRRAGRAPCPHIKTLLAQKVEDLERRLEELAALRRDLRRLLASWRTRPPGFAGVCGHIERKGVK